jgi:type I restriction enzyme S subunit
VIKKQDVGINTLPNLLLPEGWVLGEVQDLVKIRNGYAFKSEDFNVEKGVPVIRQTNLSTDPVNFDKPKFLPEDFLENHSGYKIEKGDVLIGLSGSIGSLSTYREDFPALQNQRTGLLIENVEGSKKYVEYFLLSIKRELNEVAKGVAVQNISSKQIERWPIPVAPPDQQKRIVAEIEKQFSRLDEAVANLKRVKANLKRYKAAVLKAAVEGKLTEEWRKQHPDVEPASKLLERILAERRQKWEEDELAKMKAKGKVPNDDKWKKKYKEPLPPDTKGLSELPDGWVWACSEQISEFITKGTTPSAVKMTAGDGEVQFLKVYNLTFDGSLNYTHKPAFVSRITHDGELARSKVMAGDVLINIVGPPLGQVSVVPLTFSEANINQAIARYRPLQPLATMFLAYALMAKSVMGWAISRAKTTAGQSNLTLELCRCLPIPLSPIEEQERVVTEVERKLSIVKELEAQVETNLKRAERLRQSILSQAFLGRLNIWTEKINNMQSKPTSVAPTLA